VCKVLLACALWLQTVGGKTAFFVLMYTLYLLPLLTAAALAQSCQPLSINSNAAIHETELFFPSWSA
jgi:hypothetical protein